VSRYQKGKTNLDFTEARDREWQWHQLGHMQACTWLQTNYHASTPPLRFFTRRMPFLLPNQQRQSTEGNDTITYNYNQPINYRFIQVNLHWPAPPADWRILFAQSFMARMPLLTATSAFELERRRRSSPQQCYLHCLHTITCLFL